MIQLHFVVKINVLCPLYKMIITSVDQIAKEDWARPANFREEFKHML
jgi:hypothetical protein